MDEIESLIIRYRTVHGKLADLHRDQNQGDRNWGRSKSRSIRELENEFTDILWRLYNEVASQAVRVCRVFNNELGQSLSATAQELFDKSRKLLTQTLDAVSTGDEGSEGLGARAPYDVDACGELYRRLREIEEIAREALCLAETLVQGPASPADPRSCQCRQERGPEELRHDSDSGNDDGGVELLPCDEQPQHEEPRHEEPQREVPQHEGPQHDEPQYEKPQHEEPQHEEPRHEHEHELEHEPPANMTSAPEGQLHPLDTAEGVSEGGQGRPDPVIQNAEDAATREALAPETLPAPEVSQREPVLGPHPGPSHRPAGELHTPEPVPAPVNPDAVIRRAAEFAKDPKTFPECWFFVEFLTRRHPDLDGLGSLPTRELLELGYHCLRPSGMEIGIEEFSASIRANLDATFARYHELSVPRRLMAVAVSAPLVPFHGLGAELVSQAAFDPGIPHSLRRWALSTSMFWAAHKRPFERPGVDARALREEARRAAADALKRLFESGKGMIFKFHLGNAVRNRLFPTHGRGELTWILDEVTGAKVSEPSKGIREWHRTFSPEDYLDRVSRDAMGPLKAKDIEGGARKRLLTILTDIHRLVGDWIRTFEDLRGQKVRDTAAPGDHFQVECRNLCREFSDLASDCRQELQRLSDGEFGVAKAWLERALAVFEGRLGGQ